jgi:hypothetical protein
MSFGKVMVDNMSVFQNSSKLFGHVKVDISANPTDDDCLKACPRHIDYVCGTDGVTYINPCLMEIAACMNPEVCL